MLDGPKKQAQNTNMTNDLKKMGMPAKKDAEVTPELMRLSTKLSAKVAAGVPITKSEAKLFAEEYLSSLIPQSLTTLASIISDNDVDPNVRVKAIQMVMDRVMGKVKEEMELNVTSNQILADITARRRDEEVIDAET